MYQVARTKKHKSMWNLVKLTSVCEQCEWFKKVGSYDSGNSNYDFSKE